ncbi:MAG: hypothetical protein U0514_04545, partial [Candidatus Andersenbacteria bacterium]
VTANPQLDLVYGWTEKFGAETGLQNYHAWSERSVISDNFIQPSALIFTRALFERTAGWGEVLTRAGGYDDWDFTVTAAEVGARGLLVPQVWARWRRHAGNDFPRMMKKFAHCRRAIYQRHYWYFVERWPYFIGVLAQSLHAVQLRYELEFGASDRLVASLDRQVATLRKEIRAAAARATAYEQKIAAAQGLEQEQRQLESEVAQLRRLLATQYVHK